MDVIFLDPVADDCDREVDLQESLHLAELEAYLQKNGFTTHRIEARMKQLSVSSAVFEAMERKPFIVSVRAQYRSLAYCLEFIREINSFGKVHKPLILVEGNVPTFSASQLLQQVPLGYIDALMLGEVENTIFHIIQNIKSNTDWRHTSNLVINDGQKLKYTSIANLEENIDLFPAPLRKADIYNQDSWVEIRSSRGCYYNCAFCNVSTFFGGSKWRGHSPSRIISEIKDLYKKGARRFYFVDELFFGPGAKGKRRAYEIATKILEEGLKIEWQIFCRIDDVELNLFKYLKKSGLSQVSVGIEGGSQTQLDRMHKLQSVEQVETAIQLLQLLKIKIIPSFIVFDPYVTLEEIKATIDLIKTSDLITYLGPNCIIPFNGTDLTNQLEKDDLLDKSKYILRDYIFETRMSDPKVEMLRSAWESWRIWIDKEYDNLATKLSRVSHKVNLGLMSKNENSGHVFKLAQQLKKYETDYVLYCIEKLREQDFCCNISDLHFQWSNKISQIASVFPR